MRNVIAHDYGEVDPERVWTTISDDIPDLWQTLQAGLS